jgi:hypothetical protein
MYSQMAGLLTTASLDEYWISYQPQSREDSQQAACILGICWFESLKVEHTPGTNTAMKNISCFTDSQYQIG